VNDVFSYDPYYLLGNILADKIVLEGGACAGKTSVINELEKRGFFVIPEAALQLIEEEHLTVGRVYPWTDFKEFNR